MAQINQPVAFLTEALEAVDQLDAARAALRGREADEAQSEAELTALKKQIEKEKAQTLKSRRNEVAAQFDDQLKQNEMAIREVNDKRSKARSEGVSARISEQTAPLYAIHEKLEKELKELFRAARVPGFCRSRLYYTLFMPRGAGEILTVLLLFLLLFLALPFFVNWLIPGEALWHWLVIYPLDIVIFGGLYLSVANATKGRHGEAIRAGRKLRSQIRDNEREIRKLSGRIRKDKDDTLYNLQAFDEKLAKLNENRQGISQEQAAALQQFDTETKLVLTEEIDNRYREALAALSDKHTADTRAREAAAEAVQSGQTALTNAYSQYIGAEYMKHDSLVRMLELLQSGEAKTVSEAAEKL